jgi:hypothetical protein
MVDFQYAFIQQVSERKDFSLIWMIEKTETDDENIQLSLTPLEAWIND